MTGWYPDPSGRHQSRFFDGVQWTAHVADAGVVSNDPPALQPGSLPSATRPEQPGPAAATQRRRRWFVSFAAVAMAATVITAAVVWSLRATEDAVTGTGPGTVNSPLTVAPRTCTEAAASTVQDIASGLEPPAGALADAHTVVVPSDRRNSAGWPKQIVAARISGPGIAADTIGTWAYSADGLIVALNPEARRYSSWGNAAQPGSKMADDRERLAAYPEAARAAVCARGG